MDTNSAPFRDAAGLRAWLDSLPPVEAVRVASLLADNRTRVMLTEYAGERMYGLTRAGGGDMSRAELASALGVTVAAVAKRAYHYRQAVIRRGESRDTA